MTEAELETYLHDHIPLSRAMAVRVASISDDKLILGAPLGPNINHRDTVFGGSASAVAILSAWSLLHLRLTAAGQPSRVVIQRNSMEYLAPISGDFTATATLGTDAGWDGFLKLLTRRGVARITVGAELEYEGKVAGRLSGEFVAFGKDRL
ncbi:thioesterase domain-containing protein [Devosia oryziradicis]|uniref:Thioesterase domain-containing protein n=1 Tax=Devosia oryziradicis TaxID=2801335 RepID=A0ABX7BVY6_9HYPH|nr:thioesterase domain-containing protein [Devosia oryziradicis]QQR35234.1 thioesterase domain-containing protein [Devosia oryziradicis]